MSLGGIDSSGGIDGPETEGVGGVKGPIDAGGGSPPAADGEAPAAQFNLARMAASGQAHQLAQVARVLEAEEKQAASSVSSGFVAGKPSAAIEWPSVDARKVEELERDLIAALGGGLFKPTDEEEVFRLLERDPALTRALEEREARSGNPLRARLAKELSGVDLQRARIAVDNATGHPRALYPPPQGISAAALDREVNRLHSAFRGLGTDEAAVFAVLENNPPWMLAAIETRFREYYGSSWGSLRQRIEKEMSSDEERRALAALDRAGIG